MSSKRAQEDKELYSFVKGMFETAVSSENILEDELGQMSKDKFLKAFRYTKNDIKMRVPAIVKVCKIAKERIKDKIFCEGATFFEATALFCTGLQVAGDYVCELASTSIAFGIWVADLLTRVDKLDELNNILPEEFEYCSKIFLDIHHDNDLFERIAYVCDSAESDENMAKVLDSIVSLIPQNEIEQSIENFDKLAWDIFDIYAKAFYALTSQRESLCRTFTSSRDIKDLRKLMNMSITSLESEYHETMGLARQLDDLDFAAATLFQPANNYYNCDKSSISTEYAVRAYNKMNELTILNPYEICGVFHILKRKQDYRCWAMGPFATAISFAAKRLPWTCNLEFEEPNNDCENFNVDAYTPKYNISMFDTANKSGELLNLSQVIYHLSGGGIIPRHLKSFKAERMALEQNGVSQNEINLITGIASVLSAFDKRSSYFWNFDDEDESEEDENEAQADLLMVADETSNNQVKELQDKLKKANVENHLIEEQRRKLQKEYDELKRLSQQEHRELVDLRNFVFNQNEDISEETPNADLKIEYPYETKHNIVVFGGHETWSKAIKPLFANVRFVSRDTLPNADMIKNADIVWVQANSIGHSKYYKILDVVRTYHISLRYFAFASAEKCAEQIVVEDMK